MSSTKKFSEDDILALAIQEIAADQEEDDVEGLNPDNSILDEELHQKDKNSQARDHKIVKCKICGDQQEWYSFGSFPNGTKKWVDEFGSICNGRMCARCNRDRAKGTMRRIRGERTGEIDS